MQQMQKKTTDARTNQICVRITEEIDNKTNAICKNENKKPSQVGFDAFRLYVELYPSLQMIKAMSMNPDLTINEEELKKKIYDAIKKTF